MCLKVYFWVSINILFLSTAHSQNSNLPRVTCVDRYSGRSGLCSYYNNCFYAQVLYEYQRITPTICGYISSYPIVCCPNTDQTSAQKPSNNGDFIFPENSNKGPNKNPGNTIRLSERKCNEYSANVIRKVQGVTLTANPETLTQTLSNCDYKNPLIVGGEETKIAEFPHMAAIGWLNAANDYEWLCGGSLISENFVLTAAHCTHQRGAANPEPSIIRVGDHNLKNDNEGAYPQDIEIDGISQHPNYQYPSKYNDIALLRLAASARLNKFVRPACLWQGTLADDQKLIATGWGKIGNYDESSDVLRKVTVNVINHDYCSKLFPKNNRKLPKGIVEEQLCAGDLEGGKDTCQGDSGGPLQLTKKNGCIFYIAGITSFGKSCAAMNSPGIYTKVSKYITWIESIVWPGE